MPSDIAELIRRADDADRSAADALFSLLYHDLHRLARRNLRGGALTLGATTLVHEAWLNVAARGAGATFPDRARFLAYASRAMRGLVVDHARRRQAAKRDRSAEVTLGDDDLALASPGHSDDELDRLGEALEELAAVEPALAELVDMHFFCGFTFVELAELRGVSERTVQRDWRKARLLLHQAMSPDSLESS